MQEKPEGNSKREHAPTHGMPGSGKEMGAEWPLPTYACLRHKACVQSSCGCSFSLAPHMSAHTSVHDRGPLSLGRFLSSDFLLLRRCVENHARQKIYTRATAIDDAEDESSKKKGKKGKN